MPKLQTKEKHSIHGLLFTFFNGFSGTIGMDSAFGKGVRWMSNTSLG